jgi:hypothetical protein
MHQEHPWVGEAMSQRMDSLSGEGHQDGKRKLAPDSRTYLIEYHSCILKFVKKPSGHTS